MLSGFRPVSGYGKYEQKRDDVIVGEEREAVGTVKNKRDDCPIYRFGEVVLRAYPKLEQDRCTVFICKEPGHRNAEQVPDRVVGEFVEAKFVDTYDIRIFFRVAEVFVVHHVGPPVAVEEAKDGKSVEELQLVVELCRRE